MGGVFCLCNIKIKLKIDDFFVFDKKFLFFLLEIGFNVIIRFKVIKCLLVYNNIVLFLVV